MRTRVPKLGGQISLTMWNVFPSCVQTRATIPDVRDFLVRPDFPRGRGKLHPGRVRSPSATEMEPNPIQPNRTNK